MVGSPPPAGSQTSFGDNDDEALYDALAATSQLTPPLPLPPSAMRAPVHGVDDEGQRGEEPPLQLQDAGNDKPELYLGVLDTQGAEVVQVPDLSSAPPRNAAASSSSAKRARADFESEVASDDDFPDDVNKKPSPEAKTYMETDAYKPSAFGDFRSYMKNKRLKLKVQEAAISEDEARAAAALAAGASSQSKTAQSDTYPPLFRGTCIYINGHTNPPYAELRRMLQLHGGELMPYLDQKTPVTHIVASNLTAKKRIEFERYKVVKPEWVVKSVEEGRRLDWRDFRCDADATGAMKAGALAPREAVGMKRTRSASAAQQKDVEEEEQEGEDEKKNNVATAGQDWRSMAKTENPAMSLYRHSGAGAGTNGGGVGPWGKGSRQKTLAGWAEKAPSTSRASAEPAAMDSTLAPQREDLRASSHHEDTLMENQAPSAPATARLQADEDIPNNDAATNELPRSIAKLETSVETKHDGLRSVNVGRTTSKTPLTGTKDIDQMPEAHAPDAKTFPSLGTDPPTWAAAVAAGHTHPSHPYAKHPSNRKAAELLSSPSWRQHNTATGDSFLAGFFEKSRLHHLSTWKSEMKELVTQAMREAGREQGSLDLPSGIKRCIMHVDFDAFFVTVGLRKRPDLVDKPVVVCHNSSDSAGESSTSEIASCSYEARKSGIRNGMSLGQARRMCPTVQTIPYDFAGYNDVAVKFYALMLEHADALEAVSIDEALLDVSMLLHNMRQGKGLSESGAALLQAYRGHTSSQGEVWTEEKQLAEALRDEIRTRTGCEASIGIGANILQARLATRKAKPGGSFHLRPEDVLDFTAALDVDDLHGIGWSMRNRFKELFGTYNVGMARTKASKARLTAELGEKMGATVWDKLHGRERDRIEAVKQRQSCGANVNYAIRFETQEEAKDFVRKLCEEVSSRLKAIRLAGRQCVVSVMIRAAHAPIEAPKFLGHGPCDTHSRSCPVRGPGGAAVDDAETIFKAAWPLIKSLNAPPDQLRGLGVTLQKLSPKEGKVTAKPEAGQSRLVFGQPEPKLSKRDDEEQSTDRANVSERKSKQDTLPISTALHTSEYDDDEDDMSASEELVPGSSDQLPRRRSVTPEPPPRPPASTQFVIPPASQLDSEVIAALPAHIQAQISAARHQNKLPSLAAETTSKNAAAAASKLSPSPAKASSTTTTPTKVNPFTTLMKRAASATPSKRDRDGPASQQKLLQQAAESRSDFVAATFSQIDPAVLQELPESMRKEIMRDLGREREASSSPLDNKRSLSESPRRRGGLLQQQRLFERAVLNDASGSHRPGQQVQQQPGRLRAMELATSTSLHGQSTTLLSPSSPRLRDPSAVSRAELHDLGIDADFYAALPREVQAEMIAEQRSRVARFKGGKQARERTLMEERRAAMEVASRTSDAAALEYDWEPLLKAKGPKELPSLKGATSLEDVRGMVRAWYKRYGKSGPRLADVGRFRSFLGACDDLMVGDILSYLKRITVEGDAADWNELVGVIAKERRLKLS
ncbi:hypothetical protein FA10DRAFT_265527 [Acaromyces ingoldii]|uniref:DNA repair protein REV1 n=1 Tax=Acaromyces ingoldii TaxID=215250 RepID=A0A316YR24_9BASI|nr:hypothetical protein FA10DRAFT_265527 [Acaromyces ingoldii]PWN91681.1 hypothetical protein FA10DRAFT_265527 [Acaromyces ingoldii]